MKCREYANQLIKQGWKVINSKDNLLTLSKDNQIKVIDLRFDISVKGTQTATGWSNSDNAYSLNDLFAYEYTNNFTPYFYCYNFGFAIPLDVVIANIEVIVHRKYINIVCEDETIKIGTYGGTFYTNKSAGATWPVATEAKSFSYSPTNWGWAGIIPANVNDPNFAFLIRAYHLNGGSYPCIDYVEITITYAPPATNLSLIPVSDKKNVEIKAQYHAQGASQGTYVQIQIASDVGFTNILKDTGQVAITPINDEDYYARLVEWFPPSVGTYYYRVAFWDDTNYTLPAAWGSNFITVGFPSVSSVTLSNDKDKYTFQAIINDTYSKLPIVTLTIGNDTELMDYVSRTGSYVYTFSKTVSLERGDFEYHIEVGNVWTVILGDIRFLHTNYNLNEEPKIEVFIGDRKINSWNHLLTDNILPDLPEIEFDTDEKIQAYDLTVKFTKNDFKIYNMDIQGISKTPEGYHIRVKESAGKDLEQVTSFSAQVINSLNLLKSLLPNYIFSGDLSEIIYLQAFLNESLVDILKRVLILNNAIGYARNRKIYLYDLSNANALFKMNAGDAQIGYDSDPSVIVNKVREYYIRKMYPVPENVFTNYDASNWTGTATNVLQTANGILPPSGNLYCLKANGNIYRTVDFLWSDFDQLSMYWNPDVATTLEIRLETDSSNYRKYTRTFSGLKGAGFVLTGTLPTEIVTKTLTFANKYIHLVQGLVTQNCSVKIELKLAGNVVATSGWQTSTGFFGQQFDNVLCDTIVLSFTNLYPVGTTYGVNCSNLTIEEYKQTYEQTGVRESQNWHNRFSGTIHLNFTKSGLTYTGTATATFGSAPPLGVGESYSLQVNKCTSYASKATPAPGGGYTWESFYISASLGVGVNNGIIEATFGASFTLDYEGQPFAIPSFSYSFDFYRVIITSIGEYVWIYANYAWQETYNLFDSLSIPFSQFSVVGSPSNQINTIRLIASTDNYYDTIYFVKNNPIPQYVEVENLASMANGVKFQERKLDGWSSKESALAFAKAFVNLFGEAPESYSKQMSMKTDIQIGDMVDCDGTILPVYKISYDLKSGQMTVFVGRSVIDTIEWLKETSRKIEAIEKTIY